MQKKEKSPSKRLRDILFVVWGSLNNDFRNKYNNSFDDYYETYINSIINKLKNEI